MIDAVQVGAANVTINRNDHVLVAQPDGRVRRGSDGGFYAQVVRIPPNFDAPVHSHNHSEIFMVLEGSCVFDGQPMTAKDMTVVAANQPYGFVSGPEGLQFLIVRNGEANFASVE